MAGQLPTAKVYVANGRRVRLTAVPGLHATRVQAGDGAHAETAAYYTAPGEGEAIRFAVPGEDLVISGVYSADDAPGAGNGVALSHLASEGNGNGNGSSADTNGGARRWPVFRLGRDHLAVAGSRVIVGLAKGDAPARRLLAPALARLVGGAGYEIEPMFGTLVRVRIDPDADPFDVSAVLRRLPGVAFAEPDLVTLYSPLHPIDPGGPPPAPGAPRPRGAPGTRSPGAVMLTALAARPPAPNGGARLAAAVAANGGGGPPAERQPVLRTIRADEARSRLNGGLRKVVVAVLDGLVDAQHPDLERAITEMVDVLGPGGGTDAVGHATACAGLAAALPANGAGVRGVAAGCRLLPVRFARPTSDVLTSVSGAVGDAAQAIEKAWRRGAWVISLSWVFTPSDAIATAIERARTLGREGKGCVVVAAVGNDGGRVHFPANLSGVVAVGACNDRDEPKMRNSSDRQPDWSSCAGPEVWVAAPGVANFTTDVRGPGGLNHAETPEGDYFAEFRGTSSSTPLVAGAAALVLAANPSLTEAQVREVLRDHAQKVTTVPFDEHGHHARMGFGRVDVAAAVDAALAMARPGGEARCPQH